MLFSDRRRGSGLSESKAGDWWLPRSTIVRISTLAAFCAVIKSLIFDPWLQKYMKKNYPNRVGIEDVEDLVDDLKQVLSAQVLCAFLNLALLIFASAEWFSWHFYRATGVIQDFGKALIWPFPKLYIYSCWFPQSYEILSHMYTILSQVLIFTPKFHWMSVKSKVSQSVLFAL